MVRVNILHLRSSGGFFGAEGVILNLAKELRNQAFNNFIVCLDNTKNPHTELLEKCRAQGLKTSAILCRGKLDFKAIFKLRQMLKGRRIQILHCHDYKANLYGLLASRFLNIKLVSTHHLWTHETPALRIYEFLDGILTNFFDKAAAVSDEVANEVSNFCVDRGKLITIYNGIDLTKYSGHLNGKKIREEFKIPDSCRIVGSVGRLTAQKGFDYFLEAARDVLKTAPEAIFLIAGDGTLRRHLEEKAQGLGIRNKIIFTGVRIDMADIYNCMDIFVLPSLREGLPLVVLEALAMKRPVIATNVGGVPALIRSGITGILLEPKDINGLANAIGDLLKDKKKADVLAGNGRRLIEDKFSLTAMANKYARELYGGRSLCEE